MENMGERENCIVEERRNSENEHKWGKTRNSRNVVFRERDGFVKMRKIV